MRFPSPWLKITSWLSQVLSCSIVVWMSSLPPSTSSFLRRMPKVTGAQESPSGSRKSTFAKSKFARCSCHRSLCKVVCLLLGLSTVCTTSELWAATSHADIGTRQARSTSLKGLLNGSSVRFWPSCQPDARLLCSVFSTVGLASRLSPGRSLFQTVELLACPTQSGSAWSARSFGPSVKSSRCACTTPSTTYRPLFKATETGGRAEGLITSQPRLLGPPGLSKLRSTCELEIACSLWPLGTVAIIVQSGLSLRFARGRKPGQEGEHRFELGIKPMSSVFKVGIAVGQMLLFEGAKQCHGKAPRGFRIRQLSEAMGRLSLRSGPRSSSSARNGQDEEIEG